MAEQSSVELEPGWKQVLGDEFTKCVDVDQLTTGLACQPFE
jgi:hypothetical protein